MVAFDHDVSKFPDARAGVRVQDLFRVRLPQFGKRLPYGGGHRASVRFGCRHLVQHDHRVGFSQPP
jgi:hypothetical protein